MTKKELMANGGAAFPSENPIIVIDDDGSLITVKFSGMELRDWFAGQVSDSDINEMQMEYRKNGKRISRSEARFLCADAMLEARK